MGKITVHSPATVSNVVCGFDCLGFALREPYDVISAELRDEAGIEIVHLDGFDLPTEPDKNVAGVAVQSLLDATHSNVGLRIEITKGIKPGSGIGSSAASSCGAVVAVNELLGSPLSRVELMEHAMAGEALSSGSRHADNVAPSMLGGFVLVRSAEPLDVVRLNDIALWAAVIHPQVEVKTSDARAVLPVDVPLTAAVRNWSNLGSFVAAVNANDLDLMSRSMHDEIVQPARKHLIPRFDDVMATGMRAGAIGGGISGSGPSMFMLCRDETTARKVSDEMIGVFADGEIAVYKYVSPIDRQGQRLVSK